VIPDLQDDCRDELRCANVHLEDGCLTTSGKKQNEEQAELPEQVTTRCVGCDMRFV
jgi:hypothetical protein